MAKRKRFIQDTQAETDDDAERDHSPVIAAVADKRKRKRISDDARADEIAGRHGIGSLADHRILLRRLNDIRRETSYVSLAQNDWRVPKDVPPWKDTREQIGVIAERAAKLVESLEAISENETYRAAVRTVDHNERYSDAVYALDELLEILAAAAAIGKPGSGAPSSSGGNRPNPDWPTRFGRAAQAFWAKNQSGATRFQFAEHGDEGINAITKWIIEVYRALAPGPNFQMLKTELSKLPAHSGDFDAE